MAQFILKITLGNSAMLTPCDVVNALLTAVTDINDSVRNGDKNGYLNGNIRDVNGNVVGSWQVK